MTRSELATLKALVAKYEGGGKTFGRKRAPLPSLPNAAIPEPVRFHTDHGFGSSSDIVLGMVMAAVVVGVVLIGLFLRA